DFAVGLLVEPEADLEPALFGFKAVQFAVIDGFQRVGNFAVDEGDFGGRRKRAGALFVDEAGRDHHDEDERADVDRSHPEALFAGGPKGFAASGAGFRECNRLAALHLEQYHQPRQHKDGDEEEKFVAHDRTDDRHFLPGRGKHAVFRELVQAADHELRGHQEKDGSGDAEEFLQVDLDAALDEHYAEENGDADAEDGADEAHQFGRVKGDGGKDKNGFHALAQDHQEDEEEEADPGVFTREEADFAFNLALKLAAGLHHENDHGDDEDGGHQHDPAFEDVLIPVEAGEDDGECDGAGKGGGESGIDGFAQVVTADFGQIRERDADDESGFDTFAERNDECLQHFKGRPRSNRYF